MSGGGKRLPVVAQALPGAPNVRPTDEEMAAERREARLAALCVAIAGGALIGCALWLAGI